MKKELSQEAESRKFFESLKYKAQSLPAPPDKRNLFQGNEVFSMKWRKAMTLTSITFRHGDSFCTMVESSEHPKPFRFFYRTLTDLSLLLLTSNLGGEEIPRVLGNAKRAVAQEAPL